MIILQNPKTLYKKHTRLQYSDVYAIIHTGVINMKKLRGELKAFCIATMIYWVYSLLVFCISNAEWVHYAVRSVAGNSVIILTPFFTFVMPVAIIISAVVRSVRDKYFYWQPLPVVLANIGHSALVYSLMTAWF